MNNFENKDEDDKLVSEETESETADIQHIAVESATDEQQHMPGVDSTPLSVSEEKVLTDEPIEVSEKTFGGMGIVQSVGHLLRNARRARNMSVDDVSRQLRLSVQQIEAIEKEDYEKLPGRVFLRGFIRNYANLVKLDPVPIIQLLPDQSPIVSPIERTPFKIKEISFSSNQDRNWNRLIIITLAMVFLALIIYLVYPDEGWRRKSEENINTPVELDTGQKTIQLDLPLSSSTADHGGGGQLLSKDPILALNTFGSLHFKFSAEAYAKVTDGDGDIIFEQKNAGGSEQTISGKRPFFVVINDAAGVELTYNDRPVEIKPYTNEQDSIARFTLE